MSGGWVRTATALLAAVVVSACTGSGAATGVDRAHGVPIRRVDVHGPGTLLGDGLTVPRGAVLAGAVFPTPSRPSLGQSQRDHRWTAVLGVSASPRRVAGALLRQARRAGFERLPRQPYCDHESCHFTNHLIRAVNGQVTAASTGRFLTVDVESRGRTGAWGSVSFSEREGEDPAGAAPAVVSEGVPPVPLNPVPGRIPSTGEAIELYDWTPRVAPGSTMVLPAVSTNGQTIAVLAVDGTPAQVFGDYVRQLRQRLVEPDFRVAPRARLDGWTVTSTVGGSRVVTLYRGHGRSYIVLSEAND